MPEKNVNFNQTYDTTRISAYTWSGQLQPGNHRWLRDKWNVLNFNKNFLEEVGLKSFEKLAGVEYHKRTPAQDRNADYSCKKQFLLCGLYMFHKKQQENVR